MRSVLSPLGSLLEEFRAERRPPARRHGSPRPGPRSTPDPEPTFTILESRPPIGAGLLSASSVLHVGFALAVVVLPILAAEHLPAPTGARVFFAEPLVIAPPPPPPAPAPPAVVSRPRPQARPDPAAPLRAPIEAPDEVVPEDGTDASAANGVPGGVEGGVPGGVVGGIVERLPDAVTPPLVRLASGIREPTKVRHVDPVYPDVAARARVQGDVIVECTVSPQGRVTDARVVRGVRLLDEAALAAVRQWIYMPPLVDGVPVRLIMTVTVRFRIR